MAPDQQITAAPRRIKILMTADTLGGVWNYSLQLAQSLGPHDVEVVLATMGALPGPDQKVQAEEIAGLTLRPSAFKLEWMSEPGRDLHDAGRWLLDLEQEFRPDLIQLNNYGQACAGFSAPTLLVSHSCVLSWWEAVHARSAPRQWQTYKALVARALKSVRLVIAPTRAMAQALTDHYRTPAPVRVIPNGRNPAAFPPGIKQPFILTAGRLWDQAKNVAALAAIAARLKLPVYAAGRRCSPDGSEVELPNLRPLGALLPGEIAGWMARAAIFAAPARYEPFGLSILEAGLAGCALVLGDIPSLRETWDGAAVFAPPDDHHRLTVSINGLIDNPGRLRIMAARARRRALRFDAQQMAVRYRDAYRELTRDAPRSTTESLPCAL